MKILIVASYLPFPLMSGGQIRLYNLIKEISDRHDVTLISEIRPNQTTKDITEVEKICKKVITVKRKKQWSAENILKSGLSSHSFLSAGHTTKELKHAIAAELAHSKYDVIHIETYYVAYNLPEDLHGVPVVLVEHNIEYKVYDKFLKRLPVVFSPLLSVDIAKIRKEEESLWKKAHAVVAVSEEDRAIMTQQGVKPYLVPNGVNVNQFTFKKKTPLENKRVLYIGDFSWIQNSDAVTFIIKDIWPEVRKQIVETDSQFKAQLWIVGRKIPESIKALSSDTDIIFDEASSQLPTPEIFQAADVLLAPIRVGGGTSYKILEAMSCGTPVVTMEMSANAIGATDEKELMVGATAHNLAEKTVSLISDKKTYNAIAEQGRKLIEKHYTWPVIAKNLEEVYSDVVSRNS